MPTGYLSSLLNEFIQRNFAECNFKRDGQFIEVSAPDADGETHVKRIMRDSSDAQAYEEFAAFYRAIGSKPPEVLPPSR